MKNSNQNWCRCFDTFKFELRMKLTAILIFIALFQVQASTYSQETKISLDLKNVTVSTVLSEIESLSDFKFFVNTKEVELNRLVSIKANKEKISKILKSIFSGTNVNYEVFDKQIILNINKQEQQSASPLIEKKQIDQKIISGTVTDVSGIPLPAVNVLIEGTDKGTQTDFDGKYTIKAAVGDVLQFSYVGMKTKKVTVGEVETINVTLEESPNSLDEVIVVAYGETTKRVTTAAVSKINTDNLLKLPTGTISESLGGRTAGLIVSSSGGGLGALPTVSIRGGGTPLLIIDGITTSNINELYDLNPKDIESFTIMKDAEAVAIYGSKGGDGAIVITTKRGKEGKLSVNYGYNTNFSKPTVLPNKLGSYELALLANEAADNDHQDRPYSDEIVQKYKDQSDPYNYPNTDWQDEVLKNYADEYRHDLSISGGSEKIQFYSAFSNFHQGSLYKFDTNTHDRNTYRMNVTSDFDKIGLKLNISLFGNIEKSRAPYSHYSTGYWQTWGHIQNQSPMNLAYTDLGLYSSVTDHPIVEIDPHSGYDRYENNNVNGQFNLEWNIPKVEGFKFKFIGYYRKFNDFRKRWKVNADQYALGSDVPLGKNQPSLNLDSGVGYRYRIQPLLTYERQFDKHKVEALAGYDETYQHRDWVSASRENYILEVDQIFAGPTDTSKNNGGEAESANAGYVGRLKYSFDNKYLLEGSIRYDGNDNFPKDKRWGTFYSGSIGWVVSEENFLKGIDEAIKLDFLKFRFSYGETGLDNGVGRFEYLPGYTLTERAYVVDGKIVPGFSEGNLVSPDITWYMRKSFNTGTDFAFFDSKLSGSVDYFFYETVNYLGSPSGAEYTDPLGTSLPKVNTDGKHRRAGWEFEVNYRDNVGDFNYSIGANLTSFDQLWVNKFDESEDQLKNPNTRETHQKSTGTRAYITDGFYTSSDDVMNNPKRNNSYNLVPGDLKYRDVNGDGQIDGSDFVRNGKPAFPRIMYGFVVDLNYRAWSLGMHFQGTGDRHIYLGDNIRNKSVGSIKYPFQTDYWKPDHTNATYPRLISNPNLNGYNNQVTSNFWLVNAKYFRMKSLQLSFDFTRDLFKDTFFDRFELYASGTNLFTISDIFKTYKIDPETNSGNNYGYPIQQVFSIGLNVGL